MASSRSTWVDFGKKSALQRLAAYGMQPRARPDLEGTFWLCQLRLAQAMLR
ncbi:hypothetical protein A2U01_0097616, partial [Trifolium medium]|nr:hypothetical protein [Trifolium medium]